MYTGEREEKIKYSVVDSAWSAPLHTIDDGVEEYRKEGGQRKDTEGGLLATEGTRRN